MPERFHTPNIFGRFTSSLLGRCHAPSLAVGLGALVLPGWAFGQEVFDPAVAIAEERAAEAETLIWEAVALTDERLRLLTAQASIRTATTRMRTLASRSRSLSEYDYVITALMLEGAREVIGDDPVLLRREIEAWSLAGAGDEVDRLTRLLVRIDPDDEIAQLRLILNRLDRMQTVSERRAVYERLIEGGADSFSPALRSRLALDLANLSREMGDDRGFLESLTLATQLDVTNKEAASLYATYILPFAETDLERIEILMNVALADPLDSGALLEVYRELLRVGAYEGARRFLQQGLRLRLRSGGRTTDDENTQTLISLWRTESVDAMLDRIAIEQANAEGLADAEREERELEGFDVGEYEEAVLSPRVELLRLLALLALEEESAGAAYTSQSSQDRLERMGGLPKFSVAEALAERASSYTPEVLRSYWRTVRALNNEIRRNQELRAWARGESAKPEYVDARMERLLFEDADRSIQASIETESAARLQRIMIHLSLGLELELVDEDLQELRTNEGSTALTGVALERIEAWLAALRGEAVGSIEVLTDLAERGDDLSWLALSVAHEVQGDSDQAALALLRLTQTQPTTALGIFAEKRAGRLLGRELVPSDAQQDLDAYATRTMPWLEAMVSEPASVLKLDVTPESSLVSGFDLPRLRITLRNVGQHPLGVGPNAPVNPRLLMSPSMVIGGVRFPSDLRDLLIVQVASDALRRNMAITQSQAERVADSRLERMENQLLEVLRFDTRLSLQPGETIETTLNLAYVPLGQVVQQSLHDRIRFRWRASQGFIAAASTGEEEGSTFVAGPQSVSSESPIVVRAGLPLPARVGEFESYYAAAEGDAKFASLLNTVSLAARMPLIAAEDLALLEQFDAAAANEVGEYDRLRQELLFVQMSEVGAVGRMPLFAKALTSTIDDETSTPVLMVAIAIIRTLGEHIAAEKIIELAANSDSRALQDMARIANLTRRAAVVEGDDLENIDTDPESQP